jgi:hypothetical protein
MFRKILIAYFVTQTKRGIEMYVNTGEKSYNIESKLFYTDKTPNLGECKIVNYKSN